MIPSFFASLVLFAADASADAPGSPSVTRTARTPGAVLVPLGDAPGSPVGVSIVAGETLCLSGPPTHGVLAPRLTDPGAGEAALVELRLEPSGAGTILKVRSASERAMVLDAAVVTGPANLALPAAGLRVEPGGESSRTFGPHVHGLIVHDLREVEPPPRMELVPLEERWGQISLEGLAGVRQVSASGAFDTPLRASGYAPLPREYLGGGVSLDFSFARWRFGVQVLYGGASAPSLVGGSSVGTSLADASLDLGYDVLRWEGLTVSVLAGLGMSALVLDAHDPHWSYVTSRTQVGSDVGSVEQDSFLLGGQVRLEQLVPLGRSGDGGHFALVLSLRAGYEQQFANMGWVTSDSASRSLGGLPLVDLGGGWASVGLGFGIFGPTWRQAARVSP